VGEFEMFLFFPGFLAFYSENASFYFSHLGGKFSLFSSSGNSFPSNTTEKEWI